MKQKILKFMAKTATAISPKLYINLSYLHNRGKFPDLKHPKNISEIILATMYSGKINKYANYVDKIKVRDFYKEWGYNKYLPKLYGIWNNTEDIDFNDLPNAFALKTNHGCGSHYICNDKNKLDVVEAKKTINQALTKKFGLAETQYHTIKPLVYCEEYINDGTDPLLPSDYKFMCVDGDIKCILIVTERTSNSYKLLTYNVNWDRLNYVSSHYISNKNFPRPKNLAVMCEIAKQIAKKFEFVRVDFFDTGDRLFLGELTFSPEGGIMSYFTDSAINAMGRK